QIRSGSCHHPVCATADASRHLLCRAATPPRRGGEKRHTLPNSESARRLRVAAPAASQEVKTERHQAEKVVPVNSRELSEHNQEKDIKRAVNPAIDGHLYRYHVPDTLPDYKLRYDVVKSQNCQTRERSGDNRPHINGLQRNAS